MIIFDNVSKVYPNGTIGLCDVNLTIKDGDTIDLGAGKSLSLLSPCSHHTFPDFRTALTALPSMQT